MFNKEYSVYLLIPEKDRYSLYEFIKRFIDIYIESSSGHLRNFNSIFNKVNTIMLHTSSYSSVNTHKINYNKIQITNINYIYEYLYKILQKYTKNNKFDVIDYFSNVYIKNLDVWGFVMSYYSLIDYSRYNMIVQYNNIIIDLIKKLLNLLLKYSSEPINIHELKEMLHDFSNDIIKLNSIK
jgi:hypothetical protein